MAHVDTRGRSRGCPSRPILDEHGRPVCCTTKHLQAVSVPAGDMERFRKNKCTARSSQSAYHQKSSVIWSCLHVSSPPHE